MAKSILSSNPDKLKLNVAPVKQCSRCMKTLPLSDFPLCRANKTNGHQAMCFNCCHITGKLWYEDNRGQCLEWAHQYRAKKKAEASRGRIDSSA